MARFLISRAVLLLLGLAVTSLLIFLTLRVLPGDVAQVIGGTTATPAQLERIRAELGLDRSLAGQYLDWLAGLLRLDLGRSLLTGVPVADDLGRAFQVTGPLTVLSLLVSLAIALPLGVLAALRHDRGGGVAISFGSQAVAAVPVLWAGLLLIVLLARGVGLVGLFPAGGFPRQGWSAPFDAVHSLVLPAVTIGLVEGAVLLRFVRSAALEAGSQDFVRTAAAKGLTRTQALIRHGLPSAGLAVLGVATVQVAGLITGAVLVESLFNLPGVGRMLVDAVGGRDLVKVQSIILVLTAIVLVLGALLDIAHRLIDPRQRVEQDG